VATEPVPSATVLLLRDGARGPEALLLRRHAGVAFAAGALVFPGGKVDAGDREPCIPATGGDGLEAEERAHRLAAVREAFEEAGVLLTRGADRDFPTADRLAGLAPWRGRLDRREATLGDFLRTEGLAADLAALVPLARWITPASNPRRFDTRFYAAAVPPGQAGAHDGRETVDSAWLRPADALSLADRGGAELVPATRANLMLAARGRTVADILALAAAHPKAPITPEVERGPDGLRVRIPAGAGYGVRELPLVKPP